MNETFIETIPNREVKKKNEKENKKSDGFYISTINSSTKTVPKETIPNAFIKSLKEKPNFVILNKKSDAKLTHFDETWTMQEYYDDIIRFVKSVIKLKVEAQKSICIMGFNSPQWFISELGAIFAGTVACGIYTTNNAEACQFIMQDCSCQLLILENNSYLNRLKPILSSFTDLRAVVLYRDQVTNENCEVGDNKIPVYNWSEFIQLGVDTITDTMVDARINNIKPDDCCVLIYTSGTTGNPKGVMITHDNLIYSSHMMRIQAKLKPYYHSYISYLPLSHVAANMGDIISTFINKVTIYFAQPDALKGSLIHTIKEVRPTSFIGVPRLFEKMHDQIKNIAAEKQKSTPKIRQSFISWVKKVGLRNSKLKMSGKSTDLSYAISNWLVFRRIKSLLGFDRCQLITSVGAPLSTEIIEYFMSIDIQLLQVYGMSECTGPHTMTVPNNMTPHSVGNQIPGTEMKLVDCDDVGVGEICMRGRHVFRGYWNNDEKTKEALDADGWLHSGDLGRVDEKGQLYIVGRIKELIITAGGENIAPLPIEDMIKCHLPWISNAMLVGDRQKYITCLLTLKTNLNVENLEPTNELTPDAVRNLTNIIGHPIKTSVDVLNLIGQPNNPIKIKIDETIQLVNSKSISRASNIQKWTLLSTDFSIPGGELGPTMKVKRMFVCDKYASEIESMYKS